MSEFERAVTVGMSLAVTVFVIAGICGVVTYVMDARNDARDAHERINRLRDELYKLQEDMKRGKQ